MRETEMGRACLGVVVFNFGVSLGCVQGLRHRGVKHGAWEPSDWGPWKCFPSIADAMMTVGWSTRARGTLWGPFTGFDECVSWK